MRQVKIVCKTVRWVENVRESEEILLDGVRHDRGEKIYLQFKETLFEDMPPVPTLLTVDGNEVRLHRKGEIGGDMRFAAGTNCEIAYRTPMGMVPLAVETERVDVFVSEDVLEVELKYNLLQGAELLGKMEMDIRAE